MSEQLETTSLAGLANTKKGTPARSGAVDGGAKSSARDAARRDGFDGFLKTFLGKDQSGRGRGASARQDQAGQAAKAAADPPRSGTAKQRANETNPSWTGPETKKNTSKGKDGGGGHAKAASRLGAREKRALREALEKTVPAENLPPDSLAPELLSPDPLPPEVYAGAFADVANPPAAGLAMDGVAASGTPDGAGEVSFAGPPVDPETAAAAEEAARIIWNILYPDAGAGAGDVVDAGGVDGDAALSRLAEALRGLGQAGRAEGDAGQAGQTALAGLGAAGLDAEAVQKALETANASAEMNIGAVLAALDDLLDGMPREALEQALARTAAEFGLAAGGEDGKQFQELAKALELKILATDAGASAIDANVLLAELGRNAAQPARPPVEMVENAGETPPGQALESADAPLAGDARSMETEGDAAEEAASEPLPEASEPLPEAADAAEVAAETPVAGKAAKDEAARARLETVTEGLDGAEVAAPEESTPENVRAVTGEVLPEEGAASNEANTVSTASAAQSAPRVTGSATAGQSAPAVALPADADVAETIDGVEGEAGGAAATGNAERQKAVAPAAKNAGSEKVETEIYGLLQQFLEENAEENSDLGPITFGESPDPEAVEKLLNAFADWLLDGDNSEAVKELAKDRLALALVLVSFPAYAGRDGAASADGDKQKIFSSFLANVENLLLSSSDKNSTEGDEVDSSLEPAKTEPAKAGPAKTEQSGEESSLTEFDRASREGGQQENRPQTATASQNAAQPAPTQAQGIQTVQGGQNSASAMLDRIENIERLAEAMKMANRNGTKSLTLALSPPELGKVSLRVVSRSGVVSAYLQVEKPEAASQLTSGLAQLRENLKAQGIELGELDIRHHQGQAAGDSDGRERKNREADPDAESPSRRGQAIEGIDDEDAAGTARKAGASTGGKGGLNLFA